MSDIATGPWSALFGPRETLGFGWGGVCSSMVLLEREKAEREIMQAEYESRLKEYCNENLED